MFYLPACRWTGYIQDQPFLSTLPRVQASWVQFLEVEITELGNVLRNVSQEVNSDSFPPSLASSSASSWWPNPICEQHGSRVFPPALSVGDGSLLPCGEGYQATEMPTEHMELVCWEAVKPLLGMGLVIPDRQAVCGVLTTLGITEGKENDSTRMVNTVTGQNSDPSSLAYRVHGLWGLTCRWHWASFKLNTNAFLHPLLPVWSLPSLSPFLQWNLNLNRRVGRERWVGNCKCVSEFFHLHLDQWLCKMPMMELIP